MEPFSIACTTCKARLKVRDESAIGQILACPKCGSMVLIDAPSLSRSKAEDSNPAHDSPPFSSPSANSLPSTAAPVPTPVTPAASNAVHRSPPTVRSSIADTAPGTYDDLDALFAEPAPQPSAHSPTSSAKPSDSRSAASKSTVSEKHGKPLAASDSAVPVAGSSAGSPIRPHGNAVSDMQDTAPEIESPQTEETSIAADLAKDAPAWRMMDWTPPSVQYMRQLVLISVAGIVGVILAVATVSLIVSALYKRKGEDQVATPASSDSIENSKNEVVDPASKNPSKSNPTPPQPTAKEPPSSSTPDASTKTVVAEPKKVEPQDPAPVSGEKNPVVEMPPAKKIDAPKDPDSPPNLEPKAVEPVRVASNDAAGKFDKLLSPATRPGTEATTANTTQPVAPSPTNPEAPNAKPAPPRPQPLNLNVDTQLQFKFPSVELKTTLEKFAQLMAEASRIPITIDADALLLRQITLDAPIEARGENLSIRQLLTESLKSVRLAPVIVEGHIVITHPPSTQLVSRSHKLDDLAGNDVAQLESLADWVRQLVAPESWIENGGMGSMKVETNGLLVVNSETVHYQLVFLFDKLRGARGRTIARHDPALVKPDSVATRGQDLMSKRLRANFSRPTRFTQVVDLLSKSSGARVVIDWQALGELGWTPETKVTLVVDDVPASEAFATLLEPMELTTRIVTGNVVQITTPSAVSQRIDWEVHSLGASSSDDVTQSIGRLRATLGEDQFRDFGGSGSILYDMPSRSLFVALPQPQQREVAKLLKQWLAKPTQ